MHSSAAIDVREIAQVQVVLDALNCAAGLIDHAGTIVRANQRLCELTVRRNDQVVGRNIREFYEGQSETKFFDGALSHPGEPRDAEFLLPRPDGSRVAVVTSVRPLPPPMEAYHVVTVL